MAYLLDVEILYSNEGEEDLIKANCGLKHHYALPGCIDLEQVVLANAAWFAPKQATFVSFKRVSTFIKMPYNLLREALRNAQQDKERNLLNLNRQ